MARVTLLVLLVLTAAAGAQTLCPDGRWVTSPECVLSLDGQWRPGYGAGLRMAPNGRYRPDGIGLVQCPDGRFYAGRTCFLLPDGRWAGVP